MAFNFSTAYKKYEQQEAQRRAYYEKLGMSQSDIEAICAFDKKQFLSDCRYQRRMQSLTTEDEYGDERSPLLVRFADVLTVYQTPSMTERFWWVDEIESSELIQKIKKLTLEELELITMYVFDSLTQKEIAARLNISQMAVSKRLKKVIGKIF